ncbi:magnesium-transporting ATPase, P-type 1 [Andreesenia angusta]|uniref:Magnesium-transporting ATPase, P-type 1 n=2 Tax=Andreesenia angusta TaxID=39480 RepID=A0A1S1VC94_9FIRM|nr:magnesium-transporting ATPase, P-type 1 [Andreesenia angusta]
MSKKLKNNLKFIFITITIGIVLYEGRMELASIRAAEIGSVLKSLPMKKIIFFMAGGLLTVAISYIREIIISRELSIELKGIKVFKIAFISNAINNISGGFSSAGVRMLFYSKEGVPAKEAAYYNILAVASFSTGLSALIWTALLNLKNIRLIFERYEYVLIAVAVLILYTPLFFMINKFKWLKKKLLGKIGDEEIDYSLLKNLFMSSILEWTVSAMFFSAISLYFSPHSSFMDIFSIFIVSSAVGVASLVPGAIGTFDVTLLLGMSLINVDTHNAIVSLIMFRLFYHIIPVAVALVLTGSLFLERLKSKRRTLSIGGITMTDKDSIKYWSIPLEKVLKYLGSHESGLTSEEAKIRLEKDGYNSLEKQNKTSQLMLFTSQFKNPIIVILLIATVISWVTGEWIDALIILLIVLASSIMSFLQEYSASNAIEELRAKVQATSIVVRDKKPLSIPSSEVVSGDIVNLSTGSLIPADGILLKSDDFFVNQSILTGESLPVRKQEGTAVEVSSIEERKNCVFMGTNVQSGNAVMLVVKTGQDTEFGQIAKKLSLRSPETEFEKGVRHFGYLLTQIMLILTLSVFAINVIFKRPAIESLLFSVALAVGITPQLLPAIISITLSKGSRTMAKEGVIVRRLAAIENFGSMDVLCTDKTGTLTEGVIKLDDTVDISGNHSEAVFRLAYINAAMQSGMVNSLDSTITSSRAMDIGNIKKIGEIPFDFTRERLSVIVGEEDECTMIVKGAFSKVLEICSHFEIEGVQRKMDDSTLKEIHSLYSDWSNSGIRVLGVAKKPVSIKTDYVVEDEKDMIFKGFILLIDHPKPDVANTIEDLQSKGVSLRVITGDNKLIAMHTAESVGLKITGVITGSELISLSDEALWSKVESVNLFAEVDPNQKERIILALKKNSHVVGYMGDGINDVPALHAADVSISVDNAVDVAKESADFVLMENSLKVLKRGIELGRTTFTNTLKYILVTTSANFGNMFSMAGLSLFLPFLPLLPKQILMINFLSDFPAIMIANDSVDRDMLDKPRKWDIRFIRSFMFTFGIISSIFDYLTFAVLFIGFKAQQEVFQSSWFVLSILTELLILIVMRTQKPFFKSKPAPSLLYASIIVGAISIALPYTPIGGLLSLSPISPTILASLIVIAFLYILVTEIAKRYFYRIHNKD